MTRPGKRVVKKGVKPIGIMDTCRENFYVYGSVDPVGGTYLMLEKDKMSSENFQEFMDTFGDVYSDGYHVMICDGSTIHWTKDLHLPKNISLVKLPPYCPELNPIERVWQDLKKNLKWMNWKSIGAMKEKVFDLINSLGFDEIYTLTAWNWVLYAQLDS